MDINSSNYLYSSYLEDAKQYAAASNANPSDVVLIYNEWRNISNFTEEELAIYVSNYYYYWYMFHLWLIAVGVLKCLCGLFGLVGYVIEAVTMLKSSHFHAVSFTYHKAILLAEFPVMLILLLQGSCNFIPNEPEKLFIVDIVISYPLSDTLGSTVDIVTVFMSLERALSLWSTKGFEKFNRQYVAWLCVFASFLVSAALNIPDMFAETAVPTDAGRLWLGSTTFGHTDNYINISHARDTVNLAKGFFITVLAVVVEVGFLRMNKRNPNSADQFSRQLCILNLACSVPVTIHSILYVIYWKYMNENVLGDAAVILPFEDAQADITKALWCLLENLFLDISYLVSHCLHFYLYLALSSSFRTSVRTHICGNNKVKEMSTA